MVYITGQQEYHKYCTINNEYKYNQLIKSFKYKSFAYIFFSNNNLQDIILSNKYISNILPSNKYLSNITLSNKYLSNKNHHVTPYFKIIKIRVSVHFHIFTAHCANFSITTARTTHVLISSSFTHGTSYPHFISQLHKQFTC